MMEKMASRTDFSMEIENYRKRCLELEEKSKTDEIKYTMLEVEVDNLKKQNKELEEQISRIQKMTSNEEYEEDEFLQLMIENKVLECEKTKAETELHNWKEKVKQLVSQVSEWESKLNMKPMNESNVASTPKCTIEGLETGAKQEFHSKVRKRLPFEKDRFFNMKIAPSTPGFTPPPSSSVIDISDEDDDNKDGFKGHITKRKRSSNIITSDDETSDDDDNAPICTLIKKDHVNEVKEDVTRQPLKRLKKSEDKNNYDNITIDLNKTGNSSSEDEEDEDEDEDDESLSGFIVESSECETGSGESCDKSEDGLNEYTETLNRIRRKKDLKLKWDLEGEMLADFGKDPELCMKAVCALYRQQTEDEKAGKVTIYHNERGFSQPDAKRASKLAEFLTDGGGDLNKTVEELKIYDSKGIKLCIQLATKYSKQLFEIYQKKEDKYFRPK
ncbi:hypothetical protein L2E82_22174 [Cichorium intybus]|uniref:Uncharacterized protein n=1 Tax=Cichorium intybus TaxID=13427 RepID=A0ACB9DXR8_CICIN|nr:hypothetical protein L2E82_22174 [Cichorium intybus]